MSGFSLCGLRCGPLLLLGVQQRGARARHMRPVEAVACALPESGPRDRRLLPLALHPHQELPKLPGRFDTWMGLNYQTPDSHRVWCCHFFLYPSRLQCRRQKGAITCVARNAATTFAGSALKPGRITAAVTPIVTGVTHFQ